jgi:uncharacterized protein (TIGR02300 family)
MATKDDRGTKRVCLNCRNKFYDLARDPILCPICQTVFEPAARVAKPVFAAVAPKAVAVVPDEEVTKSGADGVELISINDLETPDQDDIGDIDAGDLAGIEDEADLDEVGDDETFLEEVDDDEADSDMTDLVGSGHGPDDEV